jgi:hypothetical protein
MTWQDNHLGVIWKLKILGSMTRENLIKYKIHETLAHKKIKQKHLHVIGMPKILIDATNTQSLILNTV